MIGVVVNDSTSMVLYPTIPANITNVTLAVHAHMAPRNNLSPLLTLTAMNEKIVPARMPRYKIQINRNILPETADLFHYN